MTRVVASLRAVKEPSKEAAWDYGGRFVWKVNKEFNSSLEALRRHETGTEAPDDSGSNRTVGLIEYRIRQDLILVGSFGQGFKEATGAKPLLAFAG